jgi:cullin-associated NEDD8-dissociated protein 1
MSGRQDISTLLRDAEHYDPDNRYMAANDLCSELLKEGAKIDVNVERQICAAFLKQLDDQNSEVQGNAVRCIKRIVSRIQDSQVNDVATKLYDCIRRGSSDIRDVYVTCLKGLINDLPDRATGNVVTALFGNLISGISTPGVQEESVEILTELIRRCTAHMRTISTDSVNAVVQLLDQPSPSLRKKATQCIGVLGTVLSNRQLQQLVTNLIRIIRNSRSKQVTYTHIQAISAVSRTAAYKLSSYLDQVIPLFFPFCSVDQLNIDSPDVEIDHELIELCLSTFESFLRGCPREIVTFIPEIFRLSMELISYDPNYTYSGEAVDEEDWGSDFEDDIDDNADDSSWKVRRAAVHVTEATIKSRPEALSPYYSELVDKLVERFVEREENVKIAVFSTFSALIRSIVVGGGVDSSDELEMPTLVRTRSSAAVLNDQVPAIVDGVLRELNSKNVKTRQGVTSFLGDMSASLPVNLCEQLPRLLAEFKRNLADLQNPGLRMETLVILRRLYRYKQPLHVLEQSAIELLPFIQQAIRDDYFKITAEGLRLAAAVVEALPNDATVVRILAEPVLDRLRVTDIDQEVKQAAIRSIAVVLAAAHAKVSASFISESLTLIGDRMKNEVTRLHSLKALITIAKSETLVAIDEARTLVPICTELINLLHKASRTLKLTTLETLVAVLKKYSVPNTVQRSLISELPQFVSDVDLHLAQLALELVSVQTQGAEFSRADVNSTLINMIALARSPLIQGVALQKLCEAFASFAARHSGGLTTEELIKLLKQDLMTRQSVFGVARVLAAVSLQSNDTGLYAYLTACLRSISGSDIEAQLSALSIGEIGKLKDLSSLPQLFDALIGLFDSRNDEMRQSASVSLGNLAVGNLTVYLPKLLEQFRVASHRYLLLTSLKEVISYHFQRMQPYIPSVLPLLFDHCDSQDESVRTLVAECLGKLFSASPDELSGEFIRLLTSGSLLAKQVVASSVKFAASANSKPSIGFSEVLLTLLELLDLSDLAVRRNTLQSLNSVAHHMPSVIRPHVPDFIAKLYAETIVKPELIHTVDLGPFTHKVDDGLPLRKASFGLLETLVDFLPEKVEPNALLEVLLRGLEDPSEEVHLLCHQILCKVAVWASGTLLAVLDAMLDLLRKSIEKQVKLLKNSQEVERATDIVRSSLRVLVTLQASVDVDASHPLNEYVESLNGMKEIANVLEAVREQKKALLGN